MKIHIVYFSATYTTRTVCQGVARHLGGDIIEHDITNRAPERAVEIPADELLVIGMPVYCGRIPEMAAERVRQFYGRETRAITLVVYGNREYDDALLELTRMVEANGFRTLAAAAFVGRHCIFPAVASGRPDAADRERMQDFAKACEPLLQVSADALLPVEVPGNRDTYCPHKRVPFCPVPTADCSNCGTCASLCPTGAISQLDAREVNADLCIACGRCVLVCTQHGRHFEGEMYQGAAANFVRAYGARKEPEFFFARRK